jgi:hypothetical protein
VSERPISRLLLQSLEKAFVLIGLFFFFPSLFSSIVCKHICHKSWPSVSENRIAQLLLQSLEKAFVLIGLFFFFSFAVFVNRLQTHLPQIVAISQ